MSSDANRSYRLLQVIIALVLLLAGIAISWVAVTTSEELDPVWHKMAEHLAATLIVGGALGIVFEFFLRKEILEIFQRSVASIIGKQLEFEQSIQSNISSIKSNLDAYSEDVANKLSISQGSAKLGLINVHPHENVLNYSSIIRDSKELYFVFNDGRTWFSTHEADMADRLADPDKTTIVILNSKGSRFIDSLSVKLEQAPETICQKIDETVQKLKRLHKSDHTLKIYGHPLPSSHSLVISESQAVLIPYLMARKGDRIPAFCFAEGVHGGFYDVIAKDVHSLISDWAEQIYPEQLPLPQRSRVR